MVLRSASTYLILKSTNTYEIFSLMPLTKDITQILLVYLKKYMKVSFIGKNYQSSHRNQ